MPNNGAGGAIPQDVSTRSWQYLTIQEAYDVGRAGRVAVAVAGVLALTVGLLAAGTLLKPNGSAENTSVSQPAESRPASGLSPLARTIEGLQAKLRSNPDDHAGWAALGLSYVQQARITADPTYYPKAEAAFAKSLQIQPKDNAEALTGSASLAAGRHDFLGALRLVDQALKINDYSATAYGVKTDALTELGRYDDALTAVQRMVNLRPAIDSLSRVSYSFELHGDVASARQTLQRASRDAFSPADKAFTEYYLGELAWNTGDVAGARVHYDAGLAADPSYIQLVEGRAKTEVAQGDVKAALEDLRQVTQILPQPSFLVELGELLESTGQQAAAKEQYDVVRATEQLFAAQGVDVDVELALFEADHGNAATALAAAGKGYAKRPLSITAQDAYGWALHAVGRNADALPLARQAVRLGSPQPALWYHLGVISAAAGDKAGARKALSKALALNPHFNPLQAPKARALLASLG